MFGMRRSNGSTTIDSVVVQDWEDDEMEWEEYRHRFESAERSLHEVKNVDFLCVLCMS
jgi:hypothetical protein